MADPRFYNNRGPFALGDLAAKIGAALAPGGDPSAKVCDVATLEDAGPSHLAFCAGGKALKALRETRAGFCIVDSDVCTAAVPTGSVAIRVGSAVHAFAAIAAFFYPENGLASASQISPVDSTARIGKDVYLAPGVVIGPGAEIGDRCRIEANAVIGPGVTVGRDSRIGSNVTVSHACIGDDVLICPGAQIGQPGFGFASGPSGHVKIPQLGRVIIQDRVEVGASSTIDRGALRDTVIGEGTKIDNLVHIGHNTRTGRHCIIVAQTGISGSCELGDFVVLGGQVGISDHVQIGDGARLAARTAATPGVLPGGQDYGGVPARLLKDWKREVAAVAMLARRKKRDGNG